MRYDTWFYLALAPAHSSPEPDGEEIVETAWLDARRCARRGTAAASCCWCSRRSTSSRSLAQYETAEDALAAARAANVEPILPRVDASGDEPRILLPGDWGY